MSDLDKSYPAGGRTDSSQQQEARAMPFFPAPGHGQTGQLTAAAPPLVPQQPSGRHSPHSPPHSPPPSPANPPGQAADPATGEQRPGGGTAAVVKGRITIEDEVFDKIAALAALEVHGVAALSARPDRVQVHVQDSEVALDLAVVVEYGSVILDVAKVVKTNVARVASLMLGMRVTAVNVVVDDVRMPADR
jgi:uncharacterized alkaline shock family protein YloU